MSCYEWETGEFTLPKKEFSSFKKGLIDSWNLVVEQDVDLIKKLVAEVRLENKGKHNVQWYTEVIKTLNKTKDTWKYGGYSQELIWNFKTIPPHDIVALLTNEKIKIILENGKSTEKTVACAPRIPKKDELKFIAKSSNLIDVDDLEIKFDSDKSIVIWNVNENNHAVDNAHNSYIGKLFFQQLSKVQWTRNTGGFLFGNNEHNIISGKYSAGGGGSILGKCFGPIGEKEKQNNQEAVQETSRPRQRG